MAQSVGTFNNTCLLYQDNRGHGPASRGAIECAKMFSVAMDAHKSGASIPDRHNLIENAPKIPYYLDKRGEKVKSKEALVESLVLGHIYSKVEEYITKIIQEENENVEFVLDIDMRLDNYEDCLALWAGHVAECARRKREIMFGNGVADTLYLRNIGSGPNGKTFASSHERHLYKLRERELFDALIDEYRNHFEDSVTLHYSNNYSGILGINNEVKMVFMMLSRQYIASVVYTATYNHARNGNDEFKRSVSFCWDICGPELHAIKFKAMLRKNKQNSIDVILNTERNFM